MQRQDERQPDPRSIDPFSLINSPPNRGGEPVGSIDRGKLFNAPPGNKMICFTNYTLQLSVEEKSMILNSHTF